MKQITFKEIKKELGVDYMDNNAFANWICCMLIDVAELNEFESGNYRKNGHTEIADIKADYAELIRKSKSNLHNKLAENGYYDR